MQYSNSVWDDPEILNELRRLASFKVHSAAQLTALLNKKFNTNLSRAAIIGKCNRCGIGLLPPAPPKTPSTAVRARTASPRLPKSTRIAKAPIKRDTEAPKPLGNVDDGCRWLHGLAEHRNFCGAPTPTFGASWCEYHKAKVFNPEAPSKARKFMKYYGRRAA